jgi:hypothetical protein
VSTKFDAAALHKKLSSPERRSRSAKSKRSLDEKLTKADEQREAVAAKKKERLQLASARVRSVLDAQAERAQALLEASEARIDRAEMQREEHIDGIRTRANNENTKVAEVVFINQIEAQITKTEICERLGEASARRQQRVDQVGSITPRHARSLSCSLARSLARSCQSYL